jgi:flagellar biosynthesis component FlhA
MGLEEVTIAVSVQEIERSRPLYPETRAALAQAVLSQRWSDCQELSVVKSQIKCTQVLDNEYRRDRASSIQKSIFSVYIGPYHSFLPSCLT